MKHDTNEVTEGWGQVVWTPKDKKDVAYWLRGDLNQSLISLGTAYSFDWKGSPMWHTWEAAYGLKEGTIQGIQGLPLLLRGAITCKLNDKTKITKSMKVGKDYEINLKGEHEIDDNWTFKVKQRFDSSKFGGKESPYDIGFSMTYKL